MMNDIGLLRLFLC